MQDTHTHCVARVRIGRVWVNRRVTVDVIECVMLLICSFQRSVLCVTHSATIHSLFNRSPTRLIHIHCVKYGRGVTLSDMLVPSRETCNESINFGHWTVIPHLTECNRWSMTDHVTTLIESMPSRWGISQANSDCRVCSYLSRRVLLSLCVCDWVYLQGGRFITRCAHVSVS